MKSVLTIGDGIAAWCLNFYLAPTTQLTQVIGPYPSCTQNSTAINCLRGTEKGISFLGDLMVDSYSDFISFYEEFSPAGVCEGEEIHFFNPAQKWDKRFPTAGDASKYPVRSVLKAFPEKAYFFEPESLGAWFKSNSHCDRVEGIVSQIEKEGSKVKVKINGEFKLFDQVYICTNYLASTLGRGFCPSFDTYLDYCKPVSGTYLELKNYRRFFNIETNINFSIEGKHLILKPDQNLALLGSTSNQDNVLDQTTEDIKKLFEYIQAHLEFELPAFNEWSIKTGIRHKGRKRTPFWGEIAPGINVVCGLYKNGYSFAFKAARDLVISQRTPF